MKEELLKEELLKEELLCAPQASHWEELAVKLAMAPVAFI